MILNLSNQDYLRFTKKFLVSNECWEWQSEGDPSYYPKFKLCKGKAIDAHRLSYGIFNGSLEPGRYICHRCDNRRCVRPDHLFLGTPKENFMDGVAKGRIIPLDNSKLTAEEVKEIKRQLETGATCASIARSFKVDRTVISRIKRKINYLNVP